MQDAPGARVLRRRVDALGELLGCAGAASIEHVNDRSNRTPVRIHTQHVMPERRERERRRTPARRAHLAMDVAEAANGQREQLVRVHFHAAIGCRRHLIGKLRAEPGNLPPAFVVDQGADRRRAHVQGQYGKVCHNSTRIGMVFERILQTITRYNMFEPGNRVGVAVSGGADSVFLLHALVELAPRLDLKLGVLHLDHGLRGDESRADAIFVRELAALLGLPFHTAVAHLETADNLEQTARNARRKFYLDFVQQNQLDRIATGHTRSDQAETVLFRFLRGSGTAGLSGVRPLTTEGLARPLIDLDRVDIERYLRDNSIPWREDSTNANRDFDRNRIRHDLLPQLIRDWNPALIENLSHTAKWAQDEESYWDTEIDRLAATLS